MRENKLVQMRPNVGVRDDKEEALYLLLAFYRAVTREGWETGPTEGEVMTHVSLFLENHDLHPYQDLTQYTEDLLRRYDVRHGWSR